jgi:hypothetical protein
MGPVPFFLPPFFLPYIEVGASEIVDLNRPEKNRYFGRFVLPKTPYGNMDIGSSLDLSIKPEEGEESIQGTFNLEMKKRE